MSEQLKRCPYPCRCKMVIGKDGLNDFDIRTKPGISLKPHIMQLATGFKTKKEAIAWWNNRPGEDKAKAEVLEKTRKILVDGLHGDGDYVQLIHQRINLLEESEGIK